MMVYNKRIYHLLLLVALIITTSCDFGINPKPIHDAIKANDIDKVKEIVEQGGDINITDGRGRTPLYYAAWLGKKEIAEYLISKGADMTKGASWKGYDTPLHEAAKYDHIDIVKLFLDKGVDPNIRNSAGQTPLMHATWECHPEIIGLLVKYGANINLKDKSGQTAFHYWALERRDVALYRKTVKTLIENGADVNAKGINNATPLSIAKSEGLQEIADFLIKHGAKEYKYDNKGNLIEVE
jgi:ankyrin repeat protein